MADEIPAVQILDKQNYFSQALVPLPNALPYAPLSSSSLRLRTSVLSLTVNNFTYAALGTALKWWDVHPLPPSTPAPYNDSSKYGRISAWGYAEVLESTVPSIPAGSHVWGYVPLGTLAEELSVKLHPEINDQIFVTSAHRQHVMPIYNRYFVYLPSTRTGAEISQKTAGVAYDASLRVMHATAFLMSGFVFSSDAALVVPPGPGPDDLASSDWSAQDADLADATVLIFAPGSKAAAIFAARLRGREGSEGRPRRILGVSSESSRAFVQSTGIYDDVLLTSEDPATVSIEGLNKANAGKLVVFDFGGRAGVAPRWTTALAQRHEDLLFVGVGSGLLDPSAVGAMFAKMAVKPPYRAVRVGADDMRRRAMKQVGEEKYWAEEARSWEGFRRDGIKGLGVTWGEGMGDVIKGWDRLAKGEVLPSEGLVYKL
ncbi:hypothetical protein E0Z10_g10818 [Xylaria hypoxylon]|uniref:Uncharacterized protein n=1 Tax=Xylaria hypoxylon TaxID=37992 RepID=A0A4Z0YC43_9PEZI|nr:hypothetical protein E0Z10_g10818 [Xylaria hypoxylon]